MWDHGPTDDKRQTVRDTCAIPKYRGHREEVFGRVTGPDHPETGHRRSVQHVHRETMTYIV